MDLFKLVATLGLDSSGFSTGIVAAQDLFSNFAQAVVGFSRDVMDTGMGFDQAMSNVRAVLGEQEGTVERMNALRAFALDQARSSVFTAEDTARAYYYMGMAGWKSEQMMAGLPGIMALAAASGEDLGMVSDIVTDSLTAFHLTADDTQRYVDILAQTATNANTNVALMGETFKYVAPIAGAMGADVDDVAVSIGLMANAGIKGSMAGTALRQIFTRISTNAGATSNKLGALDIITQKLGVSFRDSGGRMRDWGDVVADVRGKWKDLSDEEQVAYAKQIASERGMAGWLALMNASEEDVRKLTEAIGDATGAAQDMSETRLDSLAGDLTKFNSALDIMKIAIYDDVKGPLRDVVQWGTDAINAITDAIDQGGLTAGIEMLGAKIEEAGETFAPMLESIGRAAGPLVDALFDSVLPRLVDAGEKLAEGLLKGLGDGLTSSDNLLVGLLGTALGGAGYGLDGLSSLLKWGQDSGDSDGYTHVATAPPDTVDDWMLPPELRSDKPVDLFVDPMLAPDAVSDIESDLSGIGTGGMEDAIASAGQSGGARAAAEVESAINNGNYSINVAATVSGLLGLPFQHNASAMAQGRIFTRPTVFGVANGAYQVAGDAGPEAVVGTNSLNSMINKSVNNSVSAAMSGMLEQLGGIAERMTGYAPKIYLDGRTLVGQLAPEMNGQLNDIAEWKGYGRA